MRYAASLVESILEDAPAEPVARALQRMDDAFKRGGVSGLVRATEIRLQATKDASKLRGMMTAIAKVLATKRYGDASVFALNHLVHLGDAAMAKAGA